MKTYEPKKSLGFLLVEVARLMRLDFNERVAELGLTQAQWRALAYLSWMEGCNQACLAEQLEVKPITLTRLVDKLVSKDWVVRKPDQNDRRAVRLFLTEKAKPLLKVMQAKALDTKMKAVAGIEEDDYERFFRTLEKMKRNLLRQADKGDEKRS